MSTSADNASQTVESIRRSLAARLKAAGRDAAELDARLLVGAALGLDLTGMVTGAKRTLTKDEADRLEHLARRRLAGEPVARILGIKEFWGLPLHLSTATLVPRPDTETVVERALELLRADGVAERALRIADLGTGSGAILLALLSELPNAHGFATDISAEALQTARRNAAALGLSQRTTWIECDYGSGLAGVFELIVSNPPYIPSADIAGLDIEVRAHDPRAALDGGADGLDAYRALISQSAGLLTSGGFLVVEVGQGQSGDVEALMTASALSPTGPPKADLGGIPRAVSARRLPR
ncbi:MULTISPECIES: peptide chain release factor N(5)-glutamine methyltransferase [Bradyrhizobium]|jgi:release factor glutamine methyltransferase|uniref:peptide chain release factor N(5)-glutamine methyltransferase n=1 Tax=Bradyrhizobium TaxID=374 RepID=UPI000488D332|nr:MULTISPECIES: peptide chain release factor N(5)-glutamine methyltransferase [Bradyrhizobium]MCS3445354.1 release factor glutamine methyltransferase [Bradyrhizobium elkanii]MCS3563515.1 release factor glutamine methyltransferase [Bradyrhizobium elkanii]MCW2146650.1 release factor glutamine methyltransferase [Bradyrhizobium elkanii]MCW2354274.1 release factor glutamine methyltransferase [Bradyrhizobium elkanii]MCW2379480.1 release factor glutamine methyltransferase [Bradyrhizobium elkanii]